MGWPLVLMPIHIAFLHLVIDPACSVVFEAQPEEPGLMDRPPRDPKEPLPPRPTVVRAVLDGPNRARARSRPSSRSSMRRDRGPPPRGAAGFATLVLLNIWRSSRRTARRKAARSRCCGLQSRDPLDRRGGRRGARRVPCARAPPGTPSFRAALGAGTWGRGRRRPARASLAFAGPAGFRAAPRSPGTSRA